VCVSACPQDSVWTQRGMERDPQDANGDVPVHKQAQKAFWGVTCKI